MSWNLILQESYLIFPLLSMLLNPTDIFSKNSGIWVRQALHSQLQDFMAHNPEKLELSIK